jgi:hypothetical protein
MHSAIATTTIACIERSRDRFTAQPVALGRSVAGDGGGSTHGVAGSAAVIVATLFKAVGRLPANLDPPVKAYPPVGVVRIPTLARTHLASGQWKARGLPRKETQCTQLLRSFAARMAGCDAYRMVGRVASALRSLVRPRGRFTP